MKRILILVNHDLVIYNFRKELVRELLDEGYEVTVAAPDGRRIRELVQWGCQFAECGVDRHGMNIARDAALFLRYLKSGPALSLPTRLSRIYTAVWRR